MVREEKRVKEPLDSTISQKKKKNSKKRGVGEGLDFEYFSIVNFLPYKLQNRSVKWHADIIGLERITLKP